MRNFILISIIWFISLSFAEAQITQYFNPFQFGIKTVKGLVVIDDVGFKNAVREKAAGLLNAYFNTTTFEVSGDRIVNTAGADVNNAVKESYGNWKNLLREASEAVLNDETVLRRVGPTYSQYLGWQVLNIEFDSQGRLAKIYIAPAEYLAGFPVVAPCKQGIGQCLLFLFDRALRILYTVALALGVIFLMLAGILYIIKPTEAEKIHSRFQWGVIGIVVSVLSFTIVIALERWLVGGLAIPGQPAPSVQEEVTPEELIGQPSPIISQPSDMSSPDVSPQLTGLLQIDVNTAKIQDGIFSVFVYHQGKSCFLTYNIFNKTKPDRNPLSFSETIEGSRFITHSLSSGLLGIGSFAEPGDEIRVIFQTEQGCQLNISKLDLVYGPKEKLPPKEYPTTTITLKEIRGQQYLKVEIPDNLKDALEKLLGFTVVQRNIYNPPFYLYIDYEVKPADQNGFCTLYGTLRGTSVSSLSFDKTKATSLYIFNREFSITLDYKKGKEKYYVSRYIPLPNNTIGFVYVKIYDYSGSCKVANLEELSKGRTFDIETGKIYLEGGLGWDVIKQILGL